MKTTIFLVLLCATILPAFAFAEDAAHRNHILQRPVKAKDAPSIELKDTSGNIMKPDTYRGKVVLVHFWATWCVPCKDEIPTLKRLWETMKDRQFVILAVAEDSMKAAAPYAEKNGMKFPVLIDQYGGVMRAYNVRALPTSFIIGKTGKIEWEAIGQRDWSDAGIVEQIEVLLGQ